MRGLITKIVRKPLFPRPYHGPRNQVSPEEEPCFLVRSYKFEFLDFRADPEYYGSTYPTGSDDLERSPIWGDLLFTDNRLWVTGYGIEI